MKHTVAFPLLTYSLTPLLVLTLTPALQTPINACQASIKCFFTVTVTVGTKSAHPNSDAIHHAESVHIAFL